MPDLMNPRTPIGPKNSFVDEMGPALDDLMEEVGSLLSLELKAVPDSKDYGLADLAQIPDEQMVIPGHIEGASNFLEDLMGSAVFECTLYLQPFVAVYKERGITKPGDRFNGVDEALSDFDDAVQDALEQCSFVLALRIHTMNYLMKGNLRRGVTWQGWEL